MESDNNGVLSIIGQIVDNTDQVWKYLVCPMKHNYSLESLGPPVQMWGKTTYNRIDSNFINKRGNRIEYTVYDPENKEDSSGYMIVYLHSHGGCRVEGYHLLKVCGIYGASLCVFDFAGCGHSEGEFISMGIYEKEDVTDLMGVLESNFHVKDFVMWGRSMGAATALQAFPLLKGVFALVLDSPFTTVSSVYKNAVKQHVSLPGVLIDMVFAFASSEIQKKYGFDVSTIRPYDNGPLINVPTVLIGTQEDKITDYADLLELYDQLRLDTNKKVIVECKGKHNDDRDRETLARTLEFIDIIYRGNKPRQPKTSILASLLSPVLRYDQREMGLKRNDHRWRVEPNRVPLNEAVNKSINYRIQDETLRTEASENNTPQNRRKMLGGAHSVQVNRTTETSAYLAKYFPHITNDSRPTEIIREGQSKRDSPRKKGSNTGQSRNINSLRGESTLQNPKLFSFKYDATSRENSVSKQPDQNKAPGPHGTRRSGTIGIHQYSLGSLHPMNQPNHKTEYQDYQPPSFINSMEDNSFNQGRRTEVIKSEQVHSQQIQEMNSVHILPPEQTYHQNISSPAPPSNYYSPVFQQQQRVQISHHPTVGEFSSRVGYKPLLGSHRTTLEPQMGGGLVRQSRSFITFTPEMLELEKDYSQSHHRTAIHQTQTPAYSNFLQSPPPPSNHGNSQAQRSIGSPALPNFKSFTYLSPVPNNYPQSQGYLGIKHPENRVPQYHMENQQQLTNDPRKYTPQFFPSNQP